MSPYFDSFRGIFHQGYRAEMGRGGKLEEPTGVRMSTGTGSPSGYQVVRASCEFDWVTRTNTTRTMTPLPALLSAARP